MFAGSTSVALPIFVQDTSSATGAGLGSLVFNTAGLVAEYRRKGSASWTAVTLVTNTLGTYAAGGFVADGGLTGAYEFCPPDAAVGAGVVWVAVRLYGAANMLPVLIEIELDAVDYRTNTGFLASVPAVVGNVGGNVAGSVATLGVLPAVPADWLTAAGVKADAVNKIQTGLSTYAGGDTTGTTSILTLLRAQAIVLTGVVAASPAPTALAFTVTLDAASTLAAAEVAAAVTGLYVTFPAGTRNAPGFKAIAAAVINSTTSVALTFAAPGWSVAPVAAEAVVISG